MELVQIWVETAYAWAQELFAVGAGPSGLVRQQSKKGKLLH